jgi:DegV family protein with EDD domain
MPVAVVTDGGASLPATLAESAGVTVVPLRASAGPGGAALTAGPPPAGFAEALAAAGEEGALVLTVARSMSSGTFEAARLAALHARRPVEVVDTRTAAGGQALVALAAAGAARAGRPLAEVRGAAERAAAKVRLVAHVPTLDQLVAGGRLPAPVAAAATRLGLQPLFAFADGRIRPLRPARSADAARRRVLDDWRASRVEGARLHVCALHAQAPEAAGRLLAAVEAEVEPATAFIAEFGEALVIHTGPGLTGLAWWWEPAR